MCVCVCWGKCACLYECLSLVCRDPYWPEEGIGSLGAGLQAFVSFVSPMSVLGTEFRPSARTVHLWTIFSSLYPPNLDWANCGNFSFWLNFALDTTDQYLCTPVWKSEWEGSFVFLIQCFIVWLRLALKTQLPCLSPLNNGITDLCHRLSLTKLVLLVAEV